MFAKKAIEYLKEWLLWALLVLLLMLFVVSHNVIPTESMVSTINVGDHILTTMIPYYYREPERLEIVVFHHNKESWVKRVIGLPGDVIDIRDGNVYVNDEKLDESAYLRDEGISTPMNYVDLHPIEFPYTVPEDSYFLMGDNRTNSLDCRYLGAIKGEDIYGKAWLKIYPFDQIGLLK